MKEPKLMPFQDEPFNGDFYICNKFLQLKEEFKLTTAIELGTCLGSTTVWLARNFKKVYTIEINPDFLLLAHKKFLAERNTFIGFGIESLLGDTLDLLPGVLKDIPVKKEISYNRLVVGTDNLPIIFIDSHWGENVPLPGELLIIAQSGLKPVIAIHDFKTDNPLFGFDTYNGQPFTFEWVKPSLDLIYGEGNYNHCYNIEAAGAKRGIIYVTPVTNGNEML